MIASGPEKKPPGVVSVTEATVSSCPEVAVGVAPGGAAAGIPSRRGKPRGQVRGKAFTSNVGDHTVRRAAARNASGQPTAVDAG
jgi:hypothetical protein